MLLLSSAVLLVLLLLLVVLLTTTAATVILLLLLLLLLLLTIALLIATPTVDVLHIDIATAQIDVNAALVLLGVILQAELATDLLDAGLDLLDVAGAVVALADDDVQVRLAVRLRVPDALLEDILRLFHELAVQVDRVRGDPALGVVLAEDELRRLPVVLLHLHPVCFAFLRERLRCGPVALLVRIL